MHFVGTVALELDGPARHSVPELMASYVAAIVAAGVGIWESAGVRLGLARLIGGGLLMGGALSTRHVAGLSAMRRPTVAVWEPELVAASLFVAIVVATGVIGLRYLVRNESRHMSRPKPLAAIDISGAMVLSRIVGIQSAEWMVDERHSPAKLAARTIVIESDAVAAVIVTAPSLLVFTAVLAAVDRKLMERARASRESERRYRQVFQKSLTGRYRSTRDGQLLECNEAFARIFGYASPEDCAANVMQEAFVASDDRAQFISEPEGVGPVVDRERQMRRRDGPEIA